VKLVHLVGFIIKKSATMHGHMKGKYIYNFWRRWYDERGG